MRKFKIGEKFEIPEDKILKSMLSKEETVVKKGDDDLEDYFDDIGISERDIQNKIEDILINIFF